MGEEPEPEAWRAGLVGHLLVPFESRLRGT